MCLVPIDNCLGLSEQGSNGNCKHHYHFQKTAITSPFLRNVDHSVSPNKDQTNDPFNCFDRSHTHTHTSWQLLWPLVTWLQDFLTRAREWKCAWTPNMGSYWSGMVLPWSPVITAEEGSVTGVGTFEKQADIILQKAALPYRIWTVEKSSTVQISLEFNWPSIKLYKHHT